MSDYPIKNKSVAIARMHGFPTVNEELVFYLDKKTAWILVAVNEDFPHGKQLEDPTY